MALGAMCPDRLQSNLLSRQYYAGQPALTSGSYQLFFNPT